jgi:hypothetical protein
MAAQLKRVLTRLAGYDGIFTDEAEGGAMC